MKIHDINLQLNDFITAETGNKHALPKNPYNIIWLIENNELITGIKYEKERQEALEALKKDKKLKISNPELIKVLRNKELIEKRVLELIDNGADISKSILKILRTKTTHLLEMVVRENVPFDYNFLRPEDGYFGLQYAIVKKNRDVFNILWNHPKINKELKDFNNKSVAFHAISEQDWTVVEKILSELPHLFLDTFKSYKDTTGNMYDLFDFNFRRGIFDKPKVCKIFCSIQKYATENNVYPINELNPKFKELIAYNNSKILSEKLDKTLPQKLSNKKYKL